jgi:hypothetical protein
LRVPSEVRSDRRRSGRRSKQSAPGLLRSMFATGELSVAHCSSCLAAIFAHPLVTRPSAAG